MDTNFVIFEVGVIMDPGKNGVFLTKATKYSFVNDVGTLLPPFQINWLRSALGFRSTSLLIDDDGTQRTISDAFTAAITQGVVNDWFPLQKGDWNTTSCAPTNRAHFYAFVATPFWVTYCILNLYFPSLLFGRLLQPLELGL